VCAVVESLVKFNGTDWVGMIFGLVATYMLAKEKRWGFLVGVVGGIGWVAFGILTGTVAGILSNLCLIAFNVHGFIRWKYRRNSN
jgi:nicotinamide riboside transporter PnuC